MKIFPGIVLLSLLLMAGQCKKTNSGTTTPPPVIDPVAVNEIDFWLTRGDQSVLLQKQTGILSFSTVSNSSPDILVDSSTRYQTVDGFGYTLTGGSAQVINAMAAAAKASLLEELFGKSGLGIAFLRVSIGASDLNDAVFSYDDMPAGQTDTALSGFTLAKDKTPGTGLIPLLKQVLAINPSIKIMAVPWSAPAWMKDNGATAGGSLLPAYYHAYAQYFVKYVQQMQAEGININFVVPQNEPLNPNNNPSLVMTAAQQADFIGHHLGPAFAAVALSTKIVTYDHNCDRPDYPLAVLGDATAAAFTDGAAFHLYGGDVSAMGSVHNVFPSKNLYFTEQYTASNGNFGGDLIWHVKNVVIGSMRNWSRSALEWNLANDPAFGPHTPGGCTTCKGALTIGSDVTRNVAYYIIAHASKFLPAGSVRIASAVPNGLPNVAFQTPDGKKVLIVANESNSSSSFNIRYNNKWSLVSLSGNSVGTFVW